MRELTETERGILSQHALWLSSGGAEGERADLCWGHLCEADLRDVDLRGADMRDANLCWADLRGADLRDANLRWADLRWADLRDVDLRGADMRDANLCWADLRGADLRDANLRWADLRWADLRDVDLRGADMRDVDLDFSCWPLWCGSRGVKADDRLVAQLLWHVTRLDVSGCSGGVQEAIEHIRSMGIADLFREYRDDVS